MMSSAYLKEKVPIYFQMIEVKVAAVFTMAASTILNQVVL